MSWIPRNWTAQFLSQGLCVSLFLQSVLLSAGTLPVQAEWPRWVSAERLAQAADSVGNRLRQTHTDAAGTRTTDYSYDTRDRLLTDGDTISTWDTNGNLTEKAGEATYTWDFENRLQSVTLADGTVVTHAYDADGNRVRTEVTPPNGPPTVANHLVDPSGPLSQVIAETDGAGNLTAFYVRGDDLLAVLRPTGDRFYHADGLGSIRVLTNEAGEVTDRYTFSAFGELLAHAGSDPNAYLFVGEPLDPNSGFYYLRARWMEAGVGRFVGMDPFSGWLAEPLSLNAYIYAALSPVQITDPTGEFFDPLVATKIQVELRTNIFVRVAPVFSVAQKVAAILTMLAVLANSFRLATQGEGLDNDGRPAGRGRIQIQGGDLVPRLGSDTPPDLQFPWAGRAPTKIEGLSVLRALFLKLNNREQQRRVTALKRATRFIEAGSHYAGTTRAFYGSEAETEAARWYPDTPRIDIEVFAGSAFH